MLHAASICSLDSGINWPSWPAMAQLTTTTYPGYTVLHAASICSLNSSIPHSIMAGHGLTDHINLPWSGGAACTLLCLQSWRQCLPLSCPPTAYWSRQPTLVRWCCMYPHQPTLVRWGCMYLSSVHQTLVPSHSLNDHSNLPWSGGAACTHGNLPRPEIAACNSCLQSWRQCPLDSCV